MIILFSDTLKIHLQKFASLKQEVIAQIIEIALQCIRSGASKSSYKSFAEKLKLNNVEDVEFMIEGLIFLLTESSKNYIPELDFLDSIITLGFTKEGMGLLKDTYLKTREEIRKIASEISVEIPAYKNLEWRLDIEIASRSLRRQVNPTYLFKLETENGKGESEVQFLQTDVINLKHLVSELENALNESRSGYVRRISRNVK